MDAVDALEQMAQRFDIYASDQRGTKRFQSTSRDKAACDLRADLYSGVAKELRSAAKDLAGPTVTAEQVDAATRCAGGERVTSEPCAKCGATDEQSCAFDPIDGLLVR